MGIVVIGRNEGARLICCLQSALASLPRRLIVYVDSDSKDNSVTTARKLGVAVIELDGAIPFTAARARNAGFEYLRSALLHVEFVQFIDGDCELVSGWLDVAMRFLDDHRDIAVVCGRVRERFPERSLYNWLCDQEWDTPIGEARACGGVAMLRVGPFEEVGGFRPCLVAGEEPELCLRLRERGWKVWRLAADMTVHDAAMTRFGQWWKRTARGGYAYAEVSHLHKSSPRRIWQWEMMRAIFWAGILPLVLVAAAPLDKLASAGALLYPAQVCRIAIRRGAHRSGSWTFAIFMMLAKFAELQGLGRYLAFRLRRKLPTQILYKDVP